MYHVVATFQGKMNRISPKSSEFMRIKIR